MNPEPLIQLFLDGEISASQMQQLDAWVCADRQNAWQLAQAVALNTAIRDELVGDSVQDWPEAIDDLAPEIFTEFIEQQLAKQQQLNEDSARMRMIAEQQLRQKNKKVKQNHNKNRASNKKKGVIFSFGGVNVFRSQRSSYDRTSRRKPMLAAAVGVLLIGSWVWFGHNPASQTPVASVLPKPAVATITQTFDARWDRVMPNGWVLRLDDQVELKQGFAEITYYNGVRVMLEAPCQLTLNAGNALHLSRGKIVSNVGETGQGFTVYTDHARVLDHGTEFGVHLHETGKIDVAVFQGRVELNERKSNGSLSSGMKLNTGYASGFERNGSLKTERTTIEKMETSFVRHVPASHYEVAILKSRPMMYWQFNEPAIDGKIIGAGKLATAGKINGGVRLDADGPLGGLDSAASFDGQTSFIQVDQFPAEKLTGNFTLELWVNPPANFPLNVNDPQENFMRLISNRGDMKGMGLGIIGRNTTKAPTGTVFFTQFDLRDHYTSPPLPRGAWSHVVVSMDEQGNLRIYINGQPILIRSAAKMSNRFGTNQVPARLSDHPLYLGQNPFTEKGIQAYKGLMDDVAIYDRVLTEEEVLEHYRQMRNTVRKP